MAGPNIVFSLTPGGDFSVGDNGDATYVVQLALPPGTVKTEPSFSLVYSSQAGNERLGVGWRLQGSSAITRCAAIPATDGFRGTIAYDKKDRYCLDGQRLINVAGEYGSPGSVYRTELETWRKVIASSEVCGSGPCAFTVVNRRGETSRYGVSANSRILAVGRPDVRVWAIETFEDLNHNTIAFEYTLTPLSQSSAEDGQYYVSKAMYGGNTATNVAANRSLSFFYEARPDPIVYYSGGSVVRTVARLGRIQTFLEQEPVTTYQLRYETGIATGRSRLVSLQQCDGAATTCYPESKFIYTDAQQPEFVPEDLGLTLSSAAESLSPADTNGDGRSDMMYRVKGKSILSVLPLISTGTALEACPQSLDLPLTKVSDLVPGSASTSGRTDFIWAFDSGSTLRLMAYLAAEDGCSFAAQSVFDTRAPTNFRHLWAMDVDGNGYTDIVVAWQNGAQYSVGVYLGMEGTFRAGGQTSIPRLDNERIWPAEVNGDGMLDLVQVWHSGGGALQLTTYLSNGTSFESGTNTSSPGGSIELRGIWPMDLNGDGKTDIVQGWVGPQNTLQLSSFLADGAGKFVFTGTTDTGKGFSNFLAFWPMDANGDGSTDLVQAWDHSGRIDLILYENQGAGLGAGQVASGGGLRSSDFQSVWPVDLNGDGRTDLLQSLVSGASLTLFGFFEQEGVPDLLNRLVQRTGGRVGIDYLTLSDARVYTPGTQNAQANSFEARGYVYRQSPAQAPFQRVGGGRMQLVYNVQEDNDPDFNASNYQYLTSYHYAAALADLMGGRGWLGFEKVTQIDRGTGRKTVQVLNQDFPETGTVRLTEYRCADVTPDPRCTQPDLLLSSSITQYEAVRVAQGVTAPQPPVYQVLKARTQFDLYTYGTYDFSRGKSFRYDPYGNEIWTEDEGMISRAGWDLGEDDDVFTCSAFDNVDSATSWNLGFLRAQKISAAPDCDSFSTYDPAKDFSLSRWTYTPNWNVETESQYDATNKVELTTTTAYDEYGNVRAQTLPGNRTTTYEWDGTFHTYQTKLTSPPNEQQKQLTTYFGFDPRFGLKVAESNPTLDGNPSPLVQLSCLDSLGLPQASQGPLPTLPEKVAADSNCLAGPTTGPRTAFQSAQVITLWTRNVVFDETAKRLVETIATLQDWPTDGAKPTMLDGVSWFDGRGRDYFRQSQAPDGRLVSCQNFDQEDRIVRTSIPQFHTEAFDCSSSGGNAANWSDTSYDIYGRITRSTQPAGADAQQVSVTSTSFTNSLTATITVAAGSAEAYTKRLDYDYFNSQRQLVRMTVVSDGNAVTRYEYDRIARLISVTDPPTASNPAGVTNSITYDSLGRRIRVDNPDQNTTAAQPPVAVLMAYDPQSGLLESTTDAANVQIRYAYDKLGRLREKNVSKGGSSPASLVLYTYDDPAVTNGAGQLARLEQKEGSAYTYEYEYDSYLRQLRRTLKLGSDRWTITRIADPLGRDSQVIWPRGESLQYSYTLGQLSRLADSGTTYANFSEYPAVGGPGKVQYGNGVVETFTYSPTGQPHRHKLLDVSGNPLLDLELGFDLLFQVRSVEDRLKPNGVDYSTVFDYTSRRLTRASAPGLYGVLDFGYDASGNLTNFDGIALGYKAHRAVSGSGERNFTLEYDSVGNLGSRTENGTSWTYAYDDRGQLVEVQKDGQPVLRVPVYDDDGNRLQKIDPASGVTTVYVAPDYEVRIEGSQRLHTRFIEAFGGPYTSVAELDGASSATAPAEALYYHRDNVGSTSLTTDEQGHLGTRMAYLPYGGVYQPGTSGPQNFQPKFQGKELDEPSLLYYFGARYYDPALGRFITPDTELGSNLQQPDALNRFAFALNNPVTYADPTGHNIWQSVVGTIIGAVEIAVGVAVDILSDGALEPIGGALIGAGMNGITYSVTNSGSFSWKQYGVQQGMGAALGLVTGGFGGEAEAGTSAGVELAEDAASSAAERETASALTEAEGDVLTTSTDEAVDVGSDELGNGADELEGGEGCSDSFPAGTLVSTEWGSLPIEQLKPGMHVLARSEVTGLIDPMRVLDVRSSLSDHVTEIEFVGPDGQSDRIQTTAYHRFHVAGVGWVRAADLASGHRLIERGNGWLEVTAVRALPSAQVFTLEVEEYRTFFVTSRQVWVHNQWWGKVGGFCRTILGSSSFSRFSKSLVTRYRGSALTWDQEAIESGTLVSKAQRAGIPATEENTGLQAMKAHSWDSNNPPSQFVSLTRSPDVAKSFAGVNGKAYAFEVQRSDLFEAWWSAFSSEKEDLVLGGTRIFNPRELPK